MGQRKSPLRDKIETTDFKPLYDQVGRYRLGDTLIAHGIQSNGHARFLLRAKFNAAGLNKFKAQNDTYVPGSVIKSMKLGSSVITLGWTATKSACVYAIVCEGSGRMYIGSSMQPDRRRAVHHYWLKRYWEFGTSNIFFGSKSVAEDVEKYGVNNFQLEILKSMPDATDSELRLAEAEIIESHPREMLYNRLEVTSSSYKKSIFYNLEQDLVDERQHLLDNITLFEDLKKYRAIYKDSIPKLKAEQHALCEAGLITVKERAANCAGFYKHLLEIGTQKRQAHKDILKRQINLKSSLSQVKEKYKAATEPTY